MLHYESSCKYYVNFNYLDFVFSSSISGQQPKLCPVTFPLPVKGACGSDGDFRCIDEALKRFAASQVPQKCSCSDARPASSQCQCSIICTNPTN